MLDGFLSDDDVLLVEESLLLDSLPDDARSLLLASLTTTVSLVEIDEEALSTG